MRRAVNACVGVALMVLFIAPRPLSPAQSSIAKGQQKAPSPVQEFAVVSASRVDRAESTLSRIEYRPDETGLVVILKRTSTDEIMVHSTDFVLAFESEDEIPRRPCTGISYGMKSPEDGIRWSGLGYSVSRWWIKPGESYFALLFTVPKNVSTFSLHRSVPYSAIFTETKRPIK